MSKRFDLVDKDAINRLSKGVDLDVLAFGVDIITDYNVHKGSTKMSLMGDASNSFRALN